MIKEAKTINLKEKTFSACGKKYYLTDKISIARYREYEMLVPELTFGMDFEALFKALSKLYAALDQNKRNDSIIITHNIMNGIMDYKNTERVMPALLICALVILEEDEDGGSYDKQKQLEKIKNWEKEGYNILDFFPLAVNAINGFNSTFIAYTKSQAENLLQKMNLKKDTQPK